jgi:serine/threonine-protein phosphatase Stp1
MSQPTPSLASTGASHAGLVRKHNEDRFVDRPDLGLWAVADGAGGHTAGEVAAQMIAEALQAIPPGLGAAAMIAEVRQCLEQTHQALRQAAAQRGPGVMMASTVVVLLARETHFACLWAGDSRAYLLRDEALLQITRDHSLVQQLVDAGTITAEAAERHPQANIITRAVGADEASLDLDKVTGALAPGDRFLLCSDGISKTLSDAEIARLLAGEAPVEALLAAALARGAPDNITALAVLNDAPPAGTPIGGR